MSSKIPTITIKQHLVLLALLTLTATGIAVKGDFVWDDSLYLLQIAAYKSFDFSAILSGLGNGIEYQPVRDLTYLLDRAIWGERPLGYHLTNLVLYLLNIGAVYFLAAELLPLLQRDTDNIGKRSIWLPFWVAAIFAVHPLHVEPVAFISGGRNTLLAALFSFLATRAFCRALQNSPASRQWLYATAGWFLLAMLSKATSVTLPLFFLVLALMAGNRPLRSRLLVTLPFLLLAAAGATGHAMVATNTGLIDPLGSHVPLLTRGAIAVQIPFFYLGKLFLPTGLAADYSSGITTTAASPQVYLALTGLVLVLTTALLVRTKAPALLAAIAWYGATLVPVLYLLPSPMIVADRYAFLPSFGFCLALAWLGSRLQVRYSQAAIAGGVALLSLWAILSFRQTQVWQSGKSLWEQNLQVNPDALQALQNLGANLFVAGEYDRALELFARAKQLDPNSTAFDFFSGFRAYTRGDWPTAARFFQTALERKPDLMDALYYLGQMSEESGQLAAATECYQRVLTSRDLDRGGYRQMATANLRRISEKR